MRGQVDDAGDEPGRPRRRRGLERGLVQPDCPHTREPGRVVDPRLAVFADCAHRGAPPDPELAGDRGDRGAVLADAAADL
jgi:hypothetical protein